LREKESLKVTLPLGYAGLERLNLLRNPKPVKWPLNLIEVTAAP